LEIFKKNLKWLTELHARLIECWQTDFDLDFTKIYISSSVFLTLLSCKVDFMIRLFQIRRLLAVFTVVI